jgi:hypothetical protein
VPVELDRKQPQLNKAQCNEVGEGKTNTRNSLIKFSHFFHLSATTTQECDEVETSNFEKLNRDLLNETRGRIKKMFD